MRCLAYALSLTACVQPLTTDSQGQPDPGKADTDSPSTTELDPTPGTYRQACDGSGGVALDFDHFLAFADDDQVARVYTRGADGPPALALDITDAIGLQASDEADLEDAARVGDRIYVIASHGRKKDGTLQASRYRFVALDVAGADLSVAGTTSELLRDLLSPASWDTPDAAVLDLLAAASQLDQASVPELAPELAGTNIEGLAAVDGQLLIGFRNPQASSRALVVTLTNADDVLATGAAAHFGRAIQLDLGGLGIRSMTWSPLLGAVLVIAGPHDGKGEFRLYRWSGAADDPPVVMQDLPATSTAHPEAVLAYPNTKDVQILYDAGDATIGGSSCKKAALDDREFSDVIVHVD